MRYKDSIIEVILIERERGKTYKEISEKLKISIYKIKKAIHDHSGKDKKSNLDVQ